MCNIDYVNISFRQVQGNNATDINTIDKMRLRTRFIVSSLGLRSLFKFISVFISENNNLIFLSVLITTLINNYKKIINYQFINVIRAVYRFGEAEDKHFIIQKIQNRIYYVVIL